jgi:pseudoazurin
MTFLRTILAAFGLFLLAAAATPAEARQWDVRMVNRASDGSLMAFEPAFIRIQPGDTVRFLATNPGHNAESLPGMMPAGARAFRGRINEEIVVRFTVPGLYGYKCLPHLGMGMVGLIQVGNASNKPALIAAANRLPGLAKRNMLRLLAQAR